MVRNQRDTNEFQMTSGDDEVIKFPSAADAITANGTSGTPSFTNVEPAGITVDTINSWLRISVNGGDFYIPLWT